MVPGARGVIPKLTQNLGNLLEGVTHLGGVDLDLDFLGKNKINWKPFLQDFGGVFRLRECPTEKFIFLVNLSSLYLD